MAEPRSEGLRMLLVDEACCSPLAGVPLTVEQAERFAKLLKVVAEPSRLRVVSTIASRSDSGACGCELTHALGLSQPTVSHHLGILLRAGIIEPVPSDEGAPVHPAQRCAYFRLVPGALSAVARALMAPPT